LKVERRELVWGELACEARERKRHRAVLRCVGEVVRLGPGFADRADGSEARAFFVRVRLRCLVWKARAAFLERKDFLLRLPRGSSQSA